MKHTVRSFSIGLLTSGVIMLILFYFFDSEAGQSKELTVEEMVPLVEEEGYRIITEQDYISLSVGGNENEEEETEEDEQSTEEDDEPAENTEEEDSTEDEDSNEETEEEESEEENEDEENEEEISTYTLNIESGMTTSEFSSLLEENNIIDDAFEFNQYIEDEDYSLRVQIGEFELSSDMTMYEIAEEITR
jgi:cobalamin biosynthesis protein CobT